MCVGDYVYVFVCVCLCAFVEKLIEGVDLCSDLQVRHDEPVRRFPYVFARRRCLDGRSDYRSLVQCYPFPSIKGFPYVSICVFFTTLVFLGAKAT